MPLEWGDWMGVWDVRIHEKGKGGGGEGKGILVGFVLSIVIVLYLVSFGCHVPLIPNFCFVLLKGFVGFLDFVIWVGSGVALSAPPL